MQRKKFPIPLGATLMVVIVTLVLVSGAWAVPTYKVLYAFAAGNDGATPEAGLIFDSAGNLYGTTHAGAPCGGGTVFKLTPNPDGSWTESTLHSFGCGYDASQPIAGGLTFDQAGNLYGTTAFGGGKGNCFYGNGCGAVYKLTPNPDGSWTENVIYSFSGGTDGNAPQSSLIFDSAGNLYSTTAYGGELSGGCYNGTMGCGTIFKLVPNPDGSWTESILYSFTGGSDGGVPTTSLILDAAGNLYGAAYEGGAHGFGNIFQLTPNPDGTWTESVLHQFTGGMDGANPDSQLIFDASGTLYGTARYGGDSGFGTVFKLMPDSKRDSSGRVLYRFQGGHDRGNPLAGLIFDAAGNLYGTTWLGSVFELKPLPSGRWREEDTS
jgi:uncharacterized repeat protein (TIGR03803 family)